MLSIRINNVTRIGSACWRPLTRRFRAGNYTAALQKKGARFGAPDLLVFAAGSHRAQLPGPRSAAHTHATRLSAGVRCGAAGHSGGQGPSDRDLEAAELQDTGASSTAEAAAAAAAAGAGLHTMDPQHRKTVEVVEVDEIEGENGEPGSSMWGTVAGTAAGAALAGGLAAVAALSAPVAAAAAAVGAVVGAVAGGAVGKEVPRGVDVDSAMEFDQPHVVRAGQEADEQEALTETVWDNQTAPPPGSPGAGGGEAGGGRDAPEQFHGQATLGEHEIGDVRAGSRQP